MRGITTIKNVLVFIAGVVALSGCAITGEVADEVAKMMDRYCLEIPAENRDQVKTLVNSKSQLGAEIDITCPDEQ